MGVRGVYSRRSSWIFAVLFAGSLAFAAVMLLLARWRLARIDF